MPILLDLLLIRRLQHTRPTLKSALLHHPQHASPNIARLQALPIRKPAPVFHPVVPVVPERRGHHAGHHAVDSYTEIRIRLAHGFGEADDGVLAGRVEGSKVRGPDAGGRGDHDDDALLLRAGESPHPQPGELDGVLHVDPDGLVPVVLVVPEVREGGFVDACHGGVDVGHGAELVDGGRDDVVEVVPVGDVALLEGDGGGTRLGDEGFGVLGEFEVGDDDASALCVAGLGEG